MAEQLVYDYRQAKLSPVDRGLCDYAVKLTLTPGEVTAADVELLRELGLSDEAITIAVQVVSFFNMINRIADGLGVDLEPWMNTLTPDEWRARKASF